eukprot:6199713-Pleurochrysis_carterae.AAC.1
MNDALMTAGHAMADTLSTVHGGSMLLGARSHSQLKKPQVRGRHAPELASGGSHFPARQTHAQSWSTRRLHASAVAIMAAGG